MLFGNTGRWNAVINKYQQAAEKRKGLVRDAMGANFTQQSLEAPDDIEGREQRLL